MSNKKAILLINSDSLDVNAVLLVDKSVGRNDILKTIRKVKDEANKWQVSDIIDSMPEGSIEIESEAFYL